MKLPICTAHARIVYTQIAQSPNNLAALNVQPIDMTPIKDVPVEPAPVEQMGHIYYARIGSHIKIGWSGKYPNRLRSYYPDSTLLALHPGTRTDERNLHRRFAVYRSHGKEWYTLDPSLLDYIKHVVAKYGEPPAVTFGAKPVEVKRPKDKPHMQAKYGASFVA